MPKGEGMLLTVTVKSDCKTTVTCCMVHPREASLTLFCLMFSSTVSLTKLMLWTVNAYVMLTTRIVVHGSYNLQTLLAEFDEHSIKCGLINSSDKTRVSIKYKVVTKPYRILDHVLKECTEYQYLGVGIGCTIANELMLRMIEILKSLCKFVGRNSWMNIKYVRIYYTVLTYLLITMLT